MPTGGLELHVTGTVEPLLQVLAGADVTQLLSREPSLEEPLPGAVRPHGRKGSPCQLKWPCQRM